MKKLPLKEKLSIFTVIIFSIMVVFGAIILVRNHKTNIRSKAQIAFTPWSFAHITDTQASGNRGFYDLYYSELKKHHPQMVFHTGDFSWAPKYQFTSQSHECQPLWGFLEMQDASNPRTPLELHPAPGDHDESGCILPNYYTELICAGKRPWHNGPCGCNPWATQPDSYCPGEPGRQPGDPLYTVTYDETGVPFNPEVARADYCHKYTQGDYSSIDHQYSFTRGNIKFIIADIIGSATPYCANGTQKETWLVQEICNPENTAATILFVHKDLAGIRKIIDRLSCAHNLKAAFYGNGHLFERYQYKGVEITQGSGSFWVPGVYNDGQDRINDFITFNVFSDRIEVNRTYWIVSRPDWQQVLLSPNNPILVISGSFYNYVHPQANPSPPPTPTATPTPTPTKSPSPTPAPTPSPDTNSVTVKLKFEGINRQRIGNRLVTVDFQQSGNSVLNRSVQFANDTTGIYSNLNPFDMPSGIYDIFINGPVHLTRKYSLINIQPGNNVIDLTTPSLLTADIIDNNIVDLGDFNRMVENFGCSPTMTPTGKDCTVINADLDLNDEVDVYDYSFLVGNFSVSGNQY